MSRRAGAATGSPVVSPRWMIGRLAGSITGALLGFFVGGLLLGLAACGGAPARTPTSGLSPLALQAAREAYPVPLPDGFPVPRVPADNPLTPAKIELGRHLFFDPRLSVNGEGSCATCHRPELAFTDGRARALGVTGERHPRSAMSLANVAYNRTLTWADPDLHRLEDQARTPMFNRSPVELGLTDDGEALLARLATDRATVSRFEAAFPERPNPVSLESVLQALASFQRTLISGESPYDRLVFQGQSDALSPAAWRGMELFFSDRLGCSACHAGFNFSGPVTYLGLPSPRVRPAPPFFHNTGLYNLDGEGAYPPSDPGLPQITGQRRHRGRFRAPTLRNVGVTGPYMHDGSVATLEEALEHYARGGRRISTGPLAGDGRESPVKSDRLRGFTLELGERDDLLAFLHALTDRSFLQNPRHRDPREDAADGPSSR